MGFGHFMLLPKIVWVNALPKYCFWAVIGKMGKLIHYPKRLGGNDVA